VKNQTDEVLHKENGTIIWYTIGTPRISNEIILPRNSPWANSPRYAKSSMAGTPHIPSVLISRRIVHVVDEPSAENQGRPRSPGNMPRLWQLMPVNLVTSLGTSTVGGWPSGKQNSLPEKKKLNLRENLPPFLTSRCRLGHSRLQHVRDGVTVSLWCIV
jgi:hypothetical protein